MFNTLWNKGKIICYLISYNYKNFPEKHSKSLKWRRSYVFRKVQFKKVKERWLKEDWKKKVQKRPKRVLVELYSTHD